MRVYEEIIPKLYLSSYTIAVEGLGGSQPIEKS